jgi:hypothetical protein
MELPSPPMIARVLALVLLGGLGVVAQVVPPSAATDTVLVSLIDRPVGRETFAMKADGDGTIYTGELDLTERGGRLQVSSSMRLGADLTPTSFTAKGKSYRFVNVDTTVNVTGGVATVSNLGQTKTFEAPRRFFVGQSYSPLSARALLVRYWERNGKPITLPLMPGEPTRDVRIEPRGTDTVVAHGRQIRLRRFAIDGVVWGRETLWIDDTGRIRRAVLVSSGSRVDDTIAYPEP